MIGLALPAQATPGLTAAFTLSGTQGTFVVSNAGATAVTGWSIQFDLPAGVTVSGAQNSTTAQSGTHVTLKPAYYVNTVAAHGSTDPYSPTFALSAAATPTGCRLNNANCDGSGETPQAPVTADYTGAGTQGQYVVTNNGDAALANWTITFDLPTGVTASNAQNGALSQSGTHVTLSPAYYNATVKAHSSTEPYSPAFALSAPAVPTSCRLNDIKCDGSADAPPAAPVNARATITTTRTITLAWDAATPGDLAVSGYDVYNGTTVAASVTGTTATLAGLTPNTAYTFTVKAKDRKGNTSPASAAVRASTRNPSDDTTPPSVPGNPRATGNDATSVSLAWDASTDNTGVAGYDVYNGSALALSVPGTTATVTGLSPSTKYTFTVRARDLYDNVSPASTPLTASTGDIVSGYAKVGYFVQWGIYGRQYFVKNLVDTGAAGKLTHLLYAFENIDAANGTCLAGVTKGTSANPEDPSQGDGAGDADADYARPMSAAQSVDGVADDGWATLRGNFNQLKKLKARYPNLKTLVSIGGWTYSKYFSDVAATDASRKKFVSSCVDTWIKGNLPVYSGAGGTGVAAGLFDGIDIDWEWPGSPDGHPGNHYNASDKANLAALLTEFRSQLDALGASQGKHYQLSAFTPADPNKVDLGWDLTSTARSLDVFNVQGYDFHGSGSDNSWEPNRTGHQGNLYPDPNDPYSFHFNVAGTVQKYLDGGVSPRKLTIGFAFYGRGWQGVADGGKHGVWQSANGAAPGQFQEEAGTRGYANLIASVPNLTIYHDDVSVATYGFTGDGGQWWTFDDTWSIGKKTAWLRSKGLLGAMIWEMSGDTGTLMSAVDGGLK
ncbi:chitinase [Solihabitans fulvus]|uniref:chitinase n=2 Tax=Solihabitans fulvus TaxID=1892852 RepID=A0A5B2XAJ5_9PSEU|nr:chitinase [Solihabitans fulvus]